MERGCRLRRLRRLNNHLRWGRRRLRAIGFVVFNPFHEDRQLAVQLIQWSWIAGFTDRFGRVEDCSGDGFGKPGAAPDGDEAEDEAADGIDRGEDKCP